MRFTAAYLLFIVAINIGFQHVPLVSLATGDKWPPLSLAVGLVFVLRDFAQREIGHRVLLVMLVGAVLSYLMASPFIAAASLAAYLVSELVDWAVYSFARMDLQRRVLVSSVLSAPVDSAVFLWGIGALTPTAVVLMTASKLAGILALVYVWRRRAAAV